MIASLTGTIAQKREAGVIVEVSGIGLFIDLPSAVLAKLPAEGKTVTLLTALHFSEREGFTLYGFLEAREKRLFAHLLEVPGVGPRGALAILSAASVDELEDAIAQGEPTLLTRVSGIGRKKAQKILLELQDHYSGAVPMGGAAGDTIDLLDALVGMGYREQEAREAVREVSKEGTTEERLRQALKQLGKQ